MVILCVFLHIWTSKTRYNRTCTQLKKLWQCATRKKLHSPTHVYLCISISTEITALDYLRRVPKHMLYYQIKPILGRKAPTKLNFGGMTLLFVMKWGVVCICIFPNMSHEGLDRKIPKFLKLWQEGSLVQSPSPWLGSFSGGTWCKIERK